MIRKILSMLVMISFISLSTAYAYDDEDDHRHDQAAGIAFIAALAVATVFFLAITHDRHGGPPARHPRRPGHSRHFSQKSTMDNYASMSNEQIQALQVSEVP